MKLISLSAFILSSLFLQSAQSAGLKVIKLEGNPMIELIDDQGKTLPKKKVKLNELLNGHIILQTDSSSSLDIENQKLKVRIYPSSQVVIPRVQSESGSFDIFEIKKGRVRWESPAIQDVRIISALFRLQALPGAFLLSFDPMAPSAEMMVFDQAQDFVELNGEKSVRLVAGQKVLFLGEIEDKEISYDKLLKDKIIPKGHKSQVMEASPEDLEKYSPIVEKIKLQQLAEAKKKKTSARPVRKGEVCHSPGGLFNECAWKCRNQSGKDVPCQFKVGNLKCIRVRCNANGEWRDPIEVEPGAAERLCVNPARVGACDF